MSRPSLKTPDMKAPAVVTDLYNDMRDRRLLPLLALILVAIVATPILLGQRSQTTLPPETAGALEALKDAQAERTSALVVVEAKPGLRDPDKRLADRSPTDPFHQRYTSPVLDGSELNDAKSGETSSGEKTSTSHTKEGEGSDDGSSGGNGGGGLPQPGDTGKPPSAILYSFAINLQIVHASGSEKEGDKQVSEPQVRKKVLPPAALPGKKTPVATYLGLSPKTRKPLFLVSTEVTGTFGDGKCASGNDTCQLIEIEPGFPQTFVYGEDGDRYTFNLTKVYFVVTGRV